MYLGIVIFFLFFKQKTAYEMRISDWSSDVCSSDLDVKGDAARTMARDGLLEPLRDEVERLVPTRSFVTDHGRKQAAFEADCFAQMRDLQTEPAAVGRMLGIAGKPDRSLARHRLADDASDAALAPGGWDRARQAPSTT